MVPSDSDLDHTRTWPGFLPWAISEQASQLKSAFSYARAFEDSGGTSEENENARQNVVYLMGVLGHFVGDAAQPLHTTRHFNGWQGENPRGFTTNRTFHAWIDGGFLGRAGLKLEILQAQLRPARVVVGADGATNFFAAAMTWILEQHQQVLPLYELEKSGKFSAKNGSVEGREFLSRQLVGAAQMLGDIWFTAWTQAPKDLYLSGQLNLRRTREMPPAPGSK